MADMADDETPLAKLCKQDDHDDDGMQVDGIRGDIVATRASRALAALDGRTEVRLKASAVYVHLIDAYKASADQASDK